jgi:hypothetical protein
MAKTSGTLWTTLSVDNSSGTPVDIRNDVNSFNFATPRAVQDWTGVDKGANERGLLLADFTGTLNSAFNPSLSHAVFATVSSASVARTMSLGIGGVSLANEVLLTDYQITRGSDGALTTAVPFSLSDGTMPTWA